MAAELNRGQPSAPLPSFLQRLREQYRHAIGPPLWLPRTGRFYFDWGGAATSKPAIARSELLSAGARESEVHVPPFPDPLAVIRKVARLFFHLPRAELTYRRLRRRSKRLHPEDLYLLVERELYFQFFKGNRALIPVIISDVGPKLLAIGSAVEAVGGRGLWWQDDFHHDAPPPVSLQAAAVLTQNGAEAVLDRNPNALLFARRPAHVSQLKPIPDVPEAGAALNALFKGGREELDTLLRLRNELNCRKLHVRLHPTASAPEALARCDWLSVAPRDELLHEFASRVNLVIAANSAVQIRLLAAGTAVAHVQGLDSLGYDAYGFVRDGIVFGATSVEAGLLNDIREHYSGSEWSDKLLVRLQGPNHSKVAPLEELVRWAR